MQTLQVEVVDGPVICNIIGKALVDLVNGHMSAQDAGAVAELAKAFVKQREEEDARMNIQLKAAVAGKEFGHMLKVAQEQKQIFG
jgi:hypothetical protein